MADKQTKVILYQYQQAIEDMDDVSLLNVLDERYNAMSNSTIREKQEKFWDEADKQFTSLTVRDGYGNLQVSLPMEQNLIDTYEGRASGKILFDIQPDGKQADVEELQPAQYSLEFYLEGGNNRGNGFYDEAPVIRRQKARYGTGFTFVGLDNKTTLHYKIKEDADVSTIEDLENKDNYEPYILDAWELFPKHLNIRSVFIDEKALGQRDIQQAEDVIIEKVISLDRVNFMWGNKKGYKGVDQLKESTLDDKQKKNKDEFAINQVVIRFYYNNLSKDYIVYAPNDKVILHKSKMLYNHGKLPIESVQHYSDETCMYGIGIPRKIKYLKGYKSEIMQAILDGAAKSTSVNFIVGNSGQVEDRDMGGSGVNVWRTTVGAEQIKQVQPGIEQGLLNILNVLDDLVVQDTGENVRATIEMQTDKLGIVEIMEENKAIRHKSVDENRDMFLDRSLTMMMSNIAQFVPSLMSKTIKVKQGDQEITKIEYPYIRIKDTVITQKGKKTIFEKEDNYGKLGYFELKPGSIPLGLGVKIVTPSTHSSLPMVKREQITTYINNLMTMGQVAALDQSGAMMEQFKSSVKIDDLKQRMNDVYGFEDKLKSKTGKDKQKEKNLAKIEQLRGWIEGGDLSGQQPNEQTPETPMTNENTVPQGITGQEPTTGAGGIETQATQGAVMGRLS